MKLYTICKSLPTRLLLIFAIATSIQANASLINAEFSNGLNGWSGNVSVFDIANVTDETLFDIDFFEFQENYLVQPNGVTLSTSADSDSEVFRVELLQAFEVDTNDALLSVDVLSMADFALALLTDNSGTVLHNFLSDGTTFDVSAFVGSILSIEFIVEDEDFILDDTLVISNIALTPNITPVDTPSMAAILIISLVFTCRRRLAKLPRHTR